MLGVTEIPCYDLLVLLLEEDTAGKRPLGRPRMKWEDLIKKEVSTLGGGSN